MFNKTNDYHQNFLQLIFSITNNLTFLQFGMFLACLSCIIIFYFLLCKFQHIHLIIIIVANYYNYYNTEPAALPRATSFYVYLLYSQSSLPAYKDLGNSQERSDVKVWSHRAAK